MSAGLRFWRVTVGVIGGLIRVHWSLAISSMALLAITVALFAFAQQRQPMTEARYFWPLLVSARFSS
jgi:hypothetical protein